MNLPNSITMTRIVMIPLFLWILSPHFPWAGPAGTQEILAAIERGFDQAYVPPERRFFYLPFTHSENLADQERCVALNRAAADEEGTKWAELHADIIRRFGRFPHRNGALGRATTAEEQAFLDGGGFAG